MKNKFNLKLTLSLVSLFISLILIIVGNKNNYCLSFGFILMGVALGLYALYKSEAIDNVLVEINNDIEETDVTDAFTLQELFKERKKFTKQKRNLNFTFYLCAILLVVVGFSFLF